MTITRSLDNVRVQLNCELALYHTGNHWDGTFSTEWEPGAVDPA